MPDIDLLLSVGSVVRFAKNQIVFAENEAGTNMYIALEGLFGVYATSCTGFPTRLSKIQPGSFFGEMSAIDDWPRSATVLSEEDGAALVIEKDKLRTTFEKCPELADDIVFMLKTRAEKTAENVRRSGKKLPALPGIPQELENTEDKMTVMAALSRQIRLMNKLLLKKRSAIGGGGKKKFVHPVRLLPDGYKPINIADSNDNDDTLQAKTLFCPYCNKEQTVYIPSKLIVPRKKHSPDGRVIYKEFNILLYTNIICVQCNYTDSYLDFNTSPTYEATPVHGENLFPNEEDFTGYANTHMHTADEAVLSCYQQLHCLETVTNDALRFAKAWIHLYWLLSDYRYNEPALNAAVKAEFYYTEYFTENKNRLDEHDLVVMKMLLAELSKATRGG